MYSKDLVELIEDVRRKADDHHLMLLRGWKQDPNHSCCFISKSGKHRHYFCRDCYGTMKLDYMLWPKVWLKAVPGYPRTEEEMNDFKVKPGGVLLCLDCVEIALGRSLTPHDFTPFHTGNAILLWGMEQGRGEVLSALGLDDPDPQRVFFH